MAEVLRARPVLEPGVRRMPSKHAREWVGQARSRGRRRNGTT
jgi:hypothetical protein